MTTWIQFFVDGLMAGSLYALLALSFSLTWASMRVVNLANVQVMAVGGMAAYAFSDLGIFGALAAALLAAVLVGLICFYAALRPLLARWSLIPLIASFGFGSIVQGLFGRIVGPDQQPMPRLLLQGTWELGGVYFRKSGVIVLAIALGLLLVALVVERRTRIGLAFRATSWAPQVAEAYGISTEQVHLMSVIASSAYAGIAGALIGILFGSVSPFMGGPAGLQGMIAMLIGGAGNLVGAVVGGLALGLIELVSAATLSNALKGVASFGILLAFMIVRPNGLLRER